MSGFKTSAEEMAAFASRIDSVQAQINSEIQNLQRVVDEVTAGWKGAAATAYDTLQTQVNDRAREINQILDSIGQRMGAGSKTYQTTEDDQQQSISAITAALG